MLRRKLFWAGISLLCVLGIYINIFYYFSPFNLKKSEVSCLAWQDIKYPAQLEYLTNETPNGWTLNKISTNREEIKYIIKAFEKIHFVTEEASDASTLKLLPYPERGKENMLILKHFSKTDTSGNVKETIVFSFSFYQNNNYATTNGRDYFYLMPQLKEHIIVQNRHY